MHIMMDGWRIREYDRPWTDIKRYWRQGKWRNFVVGERKLLYSGPVLDE